MCRQDSYFLSEGRDLVNQEFSDDSTTYFSLLQLIANGLTRRADIDGAMQKDMGTFLQNLEKNYNLISRIKPMLAKPASKTTSYEIRDEFLRFWFRFICPYQALIERQQMDLLRQNMEKNYEDFTGKTLEHYFRAKMMESGLFTQVGNWWDRKGENEIDVVALNEFDKTGVVAEVKRQARKLSMGKLEKKIETLPASDFGAYKLEMKGYSIEDM